MEAKFKTGDVVSMFGIDDIFIVLNIKDESCSLVYYNPITGDFVPFISHSVLIPFESLRLRRE